MPAARRHRRQWHPDTRVYWLASGFDLDESDGQVWADHRTPTVGLGAAGPAENDSATLLLFMDELMRIYTKAEY